MSLSVVMGTLNIDELPSPLLAIVQAPVRPSGPLVSSWLLGQVRMT